MFVITTGEVAPRLFRIMGISEDENNSVYSISATLHDPNKQAVVDDGAVFETPSDTLNGYRVPNIENLRIINVNSETVQVTAAWETATLTKRLFSNSTYTAGRQGQRNTKQISSAMTFTGWMPVAIRLGFAAEMKTA